LPIGWRHWRSTISAAVVEHRHHHDRAGMDDVLAVPRAAVGKADLVAPNVEKADPSRPARTPVVVSRRWLMSASSSPKRSGSR
jgi:hypothetical protein